MPRHRSLSNIPDRPAQRVNLPPGELTTAKTIDLMSRAAMGQYGAHSPKIRALAISIIRDARAMEKDKRAEIDAIHAWVMKHLRYVNDPLWQETITYPETLAFEQQDGDCDDHAVLEAALLGAIGIRTRFVAIAPDIGPLSHVYLQALMMEDDGTGSGNKKPQWLDLDPIVKHKPSGWSVPNPKVKVAYPINTPHGIGLAPTSALMGTVAGIASLLTRLP